MLNVAWRLRTIGGMDRNARLLISYDGTDFHGWQTQPGGLRTVQEVLQKQIQRVVRHPVSLLASGRTDSGVHAYGQVANFHTSCQMECTKLRHAIGARLDRDLTIREVSDVAHRFHATRSAISKAYRYRIYNGKIRPSSPDILRRTRHIWAWLDIFRMREAATAFVGKQDFAAMANTGNPRETTIREIFRVDIERHFDEVHIEVEGSGFLYNQVRIMVGTLI